jgi:hypothetical protein
MRRLFLSILFCLLLSGLVAAQDSSPSPNDIALQRIEEAKTAGAVILDLSYLGLTELPSEIANMETVQVLLLGENHFTSFPTIITSLYNLENLDLSHNDLTSLAPEIGNLSNLQQLHLSGNDLTSLPPEIGNLSHLISLSVDFNKLRTVPAEIGNLSHLITLWLNTNQLTSLPAEINNLSNLCTLDISGNRFQSLPELGQLEKLDDANCHYYFGGNPIVTPEGLGFATAETSTPMSIVVTVNVIITATPDAVVEPTVAPVAEESQIPESFSESSWQFERLLLGGAACLGIIVSLALGLRMRRDTRKRKPK